MKKDTVVSIDQPETTRDALTEVLREGAQKLIAEAQCRPSWRSFSINTKVNTMGKDGSGSLMGGWRFWVEASAPGPAAAA